MKHSAVTPPRLDRRPRRRRRGAFFLWFALVALPFLLFGMLLAADVSKVTTVNREIRLAAESAAVAGAFQFDTAAGNGTLNQARAVQAANDTFNTMLSARSLDRRATVTSRAATVSNRSVVYRVTYEVTGLTALNWFSSSGFRNVAIVEKAEVCRSESGSGATDGQCVRPQAVAAGGGTAGDRYPGHYATHYPSFYPLHYPSHYPPHYTAHYPSHYPPHYTAHYPSHYPPHYTAHYPSHYPNFTTPDRHYPSHYPAKR